MDCKRALTETGGDLEAAKKKLRERGAAIGEKRSDKKASAGVVAAAVSEDRHAGAMIELLCETDFVARNEAFQNLAVRISQAILESGTSAESAQDVMSVALDGSTVGDLISETTGKIGERIEMGAVVKRKIDHGVIDTYIHHDKTKGVLVEMVGGESPKVVELAHNIAVHIAWGDPEFIGRDAIDPVRIETEMVSERARAIAEGKPEAAAQQIAEGRVNKQFFSKVVLHDQQYLGGSETVGQMITSATGDGEEPKVVFFVRFSVGG